MLLGAEVHVGLLVIEEAKPEEYQVHRASDQIRGAMDQLGEQFQQNMEAQLAEWVHSTEEYAKDLWPSCEYASKACHRTGARINMDGGEFNHHMTHPNEAIKANLGDLTPWLDDYVMNKRDLFVEAFVWSMDDSRHTESVSKELMETDVPRLMLFADKDVTQALRASFSSAAAEVAGCDPTRATHDSAQKIKRNSLRKDELSSSDVLDVTVFLGNLARQTIQPQAEPRMLCLIMNQTSRIMMLIEGTSLTVSRWDKKLRAAKWSLGSSDDGDRWVGIRKANGTTIRKLVDKCGSEHQKIWYTVFEVNFGLTSTGRAVWKSGQSAYRLMVVHINHAIARTACRSRRINFGDLLLLCAHFQVDFMGGDFNALS